MCNLHISYSTSSTFVSCRQFHYCQFQYISSSFNIHQNSFLSLKDFLMHSLFFFIFIAHFQLPPTFAVNLLFIGCHNCLSNNSLISPLISTKLVSVFVLCMFYKSNNFQVKVNTLTYMRVAILMKHLKLSPEKLYVLIFFKLLSETNILMQHMSLEFHAKQLKGVWVMATFNLLCKVYLSSRSRCTLQPQNCLTCTAYVGQTLTQVWLKLIEK